MVESIHPWQSRSAWQMESGRACSAESRLGKRDCDEEPPWTVSYVQTCKSIISTAPCPPPAHPLASSMTEAGTTVSQSV